MAPATDAVDVANTEVYWPRWSRSYQTAARKQSWWSARPRHSSLKVGWRVQLCRCHNLNNNHNDNPIGAYLNPIQWERFAKKNRGVFFHHCSGPFPTVYFVVFGLSVGVRGLGSVHLNDFPNINPNYNHNLTLTLTLTLTTNLPIQPYYLTPNTTVTLTLTQITTLS